MSYELADGSMSTDYKIGDKFVSVDDGIFPVGAIVTYTEEDNSACPCFTKEGRKYSEACFWWRLEAYKEPSTEAPTELEELEARIETLEEYITQLVRENKKLKEDAMWMSSVKQQTACYDDLQELISSHESYKEYDDTTYSQELQVAILNLQAYWDYNC